MSHKQFLGRNVCSRSRIFKERPALVERADGFCRRIHARRSRREEQAGREYSFRPGTAHWPKRAGGGSAKTQRKPRTLRRERRGGAETAEKTGTSLPPRTLRFLRVLCVMFGVGVAVGSALPARVLRYTGRHERDRRSACGKRSLFTYARIAPADATPRAQTRGADLHGHAAPDSTMGLREGDAHIIRNAGGIVTDDSLRSLLVSHYLLDTEEFMVINHTDCGLMHTAEEDFRTRIQNRRDGGDFARVFTHFRISRRTSAPVAEIAHAPVDS